MSLTRFEQNGLELVINTETGEAFASLRGYARMSGKDQSTISRRCQGVASECIKTAEILTPGGLQGVALIPESLIAQWIVKDNPDLATKMLQAGVRVYLHTIAGFKVSSTAIAPQTSQPQPQPQPQLPPVDIRVTNLVAALTSVDIDVKNPRWSQGLKDLVIDILGISQHRLPQSEDVVKWVGVAERAEELGYPVALVVKYRSQLGKFVKASGLMHREEKRLCNGTERTINLYQVCEELDCAISEYLDAKILTTKQ